MPQVTRHNLAELEIRLAPGDEKQDAAKHRGLQKYFANHQFHNG